MQALSHADRDPASDPTGEALLDRAHPPFKFWVPAGRALVIGHSQDPERELNQEAVLRDGIPVHRRMGGGGAVLLSPACVCVGLRFAKVKGRTIHDYFEAGSDVIRRAVLDFTGTELVSRGISDLAVDHPDGARKVVGCSLYLPRDFALFLASILVHADFEAFARYLRHPTKEPDYRAKRDHRDFLVGLDQASGRVPAPRDFIPHLLRAITVNLKTPLDRLE